MKNYNKSSLKALGVMMVLFAIIYSLVGTLALAGVVSGALPGHESEEILIVVLGYAVALLALICGIVCIAGNVGASKVFGMLFCLLGLAALIYQQVTNGTFSTFDWPCALAPPSSPSPPRQKAEPGKALPKTQTSPPREGFPPKAGMFLFSSTLLTPPGSAPTPAGSPWRPSSHPAGCGWRQWPPQ